MKRGFTLYESMITLALLSLISIGLFKFSTSYHFQIYNLKENKAVIESEYKDTLKIRLGEYDLENPNYFTEIDEEVWYYDGQYLQIYKIK